MTVKLFKIGDSEGFDELIRKAENVRGVKTVPNTHAVFINFDDFNCAMWCYDFGKDMIVVEP